MGPNRDHGANRPPHSTLVLGGARSGKSAYAEALLADIAGPRIYVATAEAGDAEMAERIAHHQTRRGAAWRTVEAPLDLATALDAHASAEGALLVDCLTLWLNNLMAADRDIEAESAALERAVVGSPGRIVLVSNEVGLGIVPDNPLARRFRDCAGRLNKRMATAADEVVFIAAGLPLTLKASA